MSLKYGPTSEPLQFLRSCLRGFVSPCFRAFLPPYFRVCLCPRTYTNVLTRTRTYVRVCSYIPTCTCVGGGLIVRMYVRIYMCARVRARSCGVRSDSHFERVSGPHESTCTNKIAVIVNACGKFYLFGHVTVRSAHCFVTKC